MSYLEIFWVLPEVPALLVVVFERKDGRQLCQLVDVVLMELRDQRLNGVVHLREDGGDLANVSLHRLHRTLHFFKFLQTKKEVVADMASNKG